MTSSVSPPIRTLVWLGIYLIPASLIAHPLIEHDTGWRLRTAEWIIANGSVPTIDPFSTIEPDQPLIAYSWLFDLMLRAAYGAGGLVGILLFRTALGCLIVAAIHAFVVRRVCNFYAAAALVGASAVALTSTLMAERPGLFTVLFALWTLDAYLRLRECPTDGTVWLLPLGYAVWANIHIQFVHGLAILFLPWIAAILARCVGGDASPPLRSPGWNRLTLLGLACFAATFVNPYGPRLWNVVLSYGRNREIYELFEELKSLRFRDPADWTILGLFAAAAFVLGRRPRFDWSNAALLAGCAYFSFHARHESWMIVLASVAVLCSEAFEKNTSSATWNLAAVFGIATAIVCVSSLRLVMQDISAKVDRTWSETFPVKAAQVIHGDPLPGPVLAPIEWGGFLEWKLPDRRIAIDGRAQLHGGRRTKRFHDLMQGMPGWDADPIFDEAAFVVVPPTYPLASLLGREPRFERTADAEVWVYRRRVK